MTLRTKLIVGLVAVALFDVVLPLPLAGAFLIYVVTARPPGIKKVVDEIYQSAPQG